MTDTMEMKFKVGDVATCLDVRQVLFRRDLVVVRSDPALTCVVTEGIVSLFFFDSNDATYEMRERGIGRMTDAQLVMLKHVLHTWSVTQTFSQFPQLVEKAVESEQVDHSQMTPITISAIVPKELANNWRRCTALLELLRIVNPKIPEDTEKLLLSWILFTVARVPNAIALNQDPT
jgi:hypothetical protein